MDKFFGVDVDFLGLMLKFLVLCGRLLNIFMPVE